MWTAQILVPGQVAQGFEEPDLVEGIPVHARGLELNVPSGPFPTQTILQFYDTWPCQGPATA